MPFRYSILAGPGHHDLMIANVLKENKTDFLLAKYFPQFSISSWSDEKEKITHQSWFYNAYSRFIWGLSTRVPYIRKEQWHILSTFALYDYLAAEKLKKADLLLAWPQVSLKTIRQFKSEGKKVWLEYPMIHVKEWQEIMGNEYEKWNIPVALRKSLFPLKMQERMETEIALADQINVLSSFAASSFAKHDMGKKTISITEPGIDHNFYSPGEEKIRGKLIVLYAGRLELLKGIPYLIEAFKSLKTNFAELWLAGPVSEEIKPFLKNIPSSIKVLGSKEKIELLALYRKAHILVLPSVQESFGLVMLEAMGCGLPVIATAQTGAPDILTEGKDGFIIPDVSSFELAGKISHFLENPLLNLDMGKSARERIIDRYTLSQYSQRFLNTLGNF